MPKVRCAVCNEEKDVADMFWCPRCEAWYCRDHTSLSFWDNKRYCPKNHEIPKGQEE